VKKRAKFFMCGQFETTLNKKMYSGVFQRMGSTDGVMVCVIQKKLTEEIDRLERTGSKNGSGMALS